MHNSNLVAIAQYFRRIRTSAVYGNQKKFNTEAVNDYICITDFAVLTYERAECFAFPSGNCAMQRKRHILSSNVSTEYKPFLLRNQSDRRTDRFIDRHAYSNNAVSNVAVNNRETTAEHDSLQERTVAMMM